MIIDEKKLREMLKKLGIEIEGDEEE